MFEFSKLTKDALLKAGWFDGRDIDIDELEKALLNDSYIVFPIVRTFLKEFGYLRIPFKLANNTTDSFHFDAKTATEDVDPLWAQDDYYKRLNNTSLCVIGQIHSDHMTLMMDANGKVYGGFDDEFFFFADSGKEAIEAICTRKQVRKIA